MTLGLLVWADLLDFELVVVGAVNLREGAEDHTGVFLVEVPEDCRHRRRPFGGKARRLTPGVRRVNECVCVGPRLPRVRDPSLQFACPNASMPNLVVPPG